MSETQPDPTTANAVTIYCTQCGRTMRVAQEHVNVPVACPHCQQIVEPWRVVDAMPRQARPVPDVYMDDPLYRAGYSWRNRWIAGTLGVLLGSFGVHRFYLGYTGIGILQIVVTLITLGLGGVWGFIEGVLCFCGAMRDVDGRLLRD